MSDMQINDVLAQMRAMSNQVKTTGVESSESPAGSNFSSLLSQSIEAVNKTQIQSGELATAFTKGETDASLAEVMVSMQKASLSFQTVLQTRNKLVEAYKDVMRMTM